MESTTWRAPMRLAIATGCSAYLLIANPAVLEAGAILGVLRMRDLAQVAAQQIYSKITGVSIEDRSLEALLNQGEWWRAAKNVVSRTRIEAILRSLKDEDVGGFLLLGSSVAYLGAVVAHVPAMFTGTMITDLAARNARPHRHCASLSILTAALAFGCLIW